MLAISDDGNPCGSATADDAEWQHAGSSAERDDGAFHLGDYTVTRIATAVGIGLTLFLTATAGACESRSLRALEPGSRSGGDLGRLGAERNVGPDSGAWRWMCGARHDRRRRTGHCSSTPGASLTNCQETVEVADQPAGQIRPRGAEAQVQNAGITSLGCMFIELVMPMGAAAKTVCSGCDRSDTGRSAHARRPRPIVRPAGQRHRRSRTDHSVRS